MAAIFDDEAAGDEIGEIVGERDPECARQVARPAAQAGDLDLMRFAEDGEAAWQLLEASGIRVSA